MKNKFTFIDIILYGSLAYIAGYILHEILVYMGILK